MKTPVGLKNFGLRFGTRLLTQTALWRILPGGLATLIVIGLLQVGAFYPLEHLAYDLLFDWRGAIPWSEQVVVVEIDEASLSQLGRFPWPRRYYTRLLNVLTEAEPAVIGLDILLSEPSPEDQKLADAMMRQGRVVLAQAWDVSGQPISPNPVLEAAALSTGHVYKRQDSDGLTRVVEPQKAGVPAFGIAVAQVYSSVYEAVPLPNLDRPIWINWPGSANQSVHYSFIRVMRGQIPAQAFRNKVVLVGAAAIGLDALQTPFNRNPPSSGVYLQAALVSNLLEQNFLQRPNTFWLWLALFTGVPTMNVALSHRRFEQQLGTWLILCLGWGVLGLSLFRMGYWLPITTPMLLFGLTGGAVALAEQLRTNGLLRQSEERYALAARGTNEGLWDWDLRADKIYFSPRWQAMLGIQEGEIDDRPQEWFGRVHSEDLELLKAAIAEHLQGWTEHFEHEHRVMHEDGTYRWMLSRGLAVRDREGRAERMVGSQTDITERKQAEEQLRRNAFYDGLTNLPNRVGFLEYLRQAIIRTQKYPMTAFAVFWLDLDRFKVVNNSLGNAIGDRLLVAIAQRLKAFLAADDIIARVGGDEFTILLNQIRDAKDATQMADRVQQVLALPFNLDGREVFVTASIGIALSSVHYIKPEHLLRDADTAMHRAKSLGGSRYQVFDQAMHTRMLVRLQLENDLRRAIAISHSVDQSSELQLFYQPIVKLDTGQITGFEALVRWQHPQRGFLPPGKFIAMAEETGLIVSMGWWILREACFQLRRWQSLFPNQPLVMSVNLSSKQFALSGLTEQIRQILQEVDIDPSLIKLEMTESTVMENAATVVNMLRRIRSLGIQLAIDDFGTGYSSLSYLRRFPINTLKIDRSFVSKMGTSHDSAEIIRTILMLAHNLGMDVTAEGVENAEQATQLLNMHCECGQGYFFSKPLSAEAATDLLEQPQQF